MDPIWTQLGQVRDGCAQIFDVQLTAFAGDALGPRNVWVPTHDNNLIQDWLDQSPFRRLRVVNLGRREPGVWLDRGREP